MYISKASALFFLFSIYETLRSSNPPATLQDSGNLAATLLGSTTMSFGYSSYNGGFQVIGNMDVGSNSVLHLKPDTKVFSLVLSGPASIAGKGGRATFTFDNSAQLMGAKWATTVSLSLQVGECFGGA